VKNAEWAATKGCEADCAERATHVCTVEGARCCEAHMEMHRYFLHKHQDTAIELGVEHTTKPTRCSTCGHLADVGNGHFPLCFELRSCRALAERLRWHRDKLIDERDGIRCAPKREKEESADG
jgi:hypothetical protein